MKCRPIYLQVVFLLLVVVFVFPFRPVLIKLIQQQLKRSLSVDVVVIGRIKGESFSTIQFFDIIIQKNGVFDFKARTVEVQLHLRDILRKNVSKIILKSARLDFIQPGKQVAEFKKSELSSTKNRFNVKSFQVDGLDFNVQFKDFKLIGRGSAQLSLALQKIDLIDWDISLLEYQKMRFENVQLAVNCVSESGNLYIRKGQYDKAVVLDVKSRVRLYDRDFLFTDISSAVLGGQLKGKTAVKFTSLFSLPEYHADLEFIGLDIARFVKDFELEKKFSMTGTISGQLTLQGKGADIKILGGNFMMAPPGGTLVIKDVSFLDKMAYRTSLDAVVESLQDYDYNTGAVGLSLEDRDLLAQIDLNGKQGKRNFQIVFHH